MKTNNNPLLKKVQGKLGKTIVYKQINGVTYGTKYPDMSNVIPSQKQVATRQRFKEAAQYVKAVLLDPEKCSALKPKQSGRRGLQLAAIAEYMKLAKRRIGEHSGVLACS